MLKYNILNFKIEIIVNLRQISGTSKIYVRPARKLDYEFSFSRIRKRVASLYQNVEVGDVTCNLLPSHLWVVCLIKAILPST
jgi:hypothetical protein